jgi:Family of unknown function (DUF6186)
VARALTVTAYVACLLAALVVDRTSRREGSRLPSVADVFGALSARRAGRVAVIIGWWWLGWHFFVR